MPVTETAASRYASQDADLAGIHAASVLPAEPNHPFFLVHYAGVVNWEPGLVDGQPFWLPKLQRDTLAPGVNGKRTVKQGQTPEQAYIQSHVDMQTRGATIIPHTVGCAGVTNYMRQISCKGPRSGREGKYYHEAWETPRAPRPGKRVKFAFDQELYNRFRFELVADGIVPPPLEDEIDEKRARAVYHRQRKEIELHGKVPEVVQADLLKQADDVIELHAKAEIPAVDRPKPAKRGKASAPKADE